MTPRTGLLPATSLWPLQELLIERKLHIHFHTPSSKRINYTCSSSFHYRLLLKASQCVFISNVLVFVTIRGKRCCFLCSNPSPTAPKHTSSHKQPHLKSCWRIFHPTSIHSRISRCPKNMSENMISWKIEPRKKNRSFHIKREPCPVTSGMICYLCVCVV